MIQSGNKFWFRQVFAEVHEDVPISISSNQKPTRVLTSTPISELQSCVAAYGMNIPGSVRSRRRDVTLVPRGMSPSTGTCFPDWMFHLMRLGLASRLCLSISKPNHPLTLLSGLLLCAVLTCQLKPRTQ